MEPSDFGYALRKLREGFGVRRPGWLVRLLLQEPSDRLEMTEPYIYQERSGPTGARGWGERVRVPWIPTYGDLLATDWEVC